MAVNVLRVPDQTVSKRLALQATCEIRLLFVLDRTSRCVQVYVYISVAKVV